MAYKGLAANSQMNTCQQPSINEYQKTWTFPTHESSLVPANALVAGIVWLIGSGHYNTIPPSEGWWFGCSIIHALSTSKTTENTLKGNWNQGPSEG